MTVQRVSTQFLHHLRLSLVVPDMFLLYWTLVSDGAVPPKFEVEFASREGRSKDTWDTASAGWWLRNLGKAKSKESLQTNAAQDKFVLVSTDKPRRVRTRYQKLVYEGPTGRKTAEDDERSKWVQELSRVLLGTKTPMGVSLTEKLGNFQLAGTGRRSSTIKSRVPPNIFLSRRGSRL